MCNVQGLNIRLQLAKAKLLSKPLARDMKHKTYFSLLLLFFSVLFFLSQPYNCLKPENKLIFYITYHVVNGRSAKTSYCLAAHFLTSMLNLGTDIIHKGKVSCEDRGSFCREIHSLSTGVEYFPSVIILTEMEDYRA